MAIKLFLFGKSLKGALMTSKYYTLSSCPTIDSVASSTVSIPHYLSKSANFMIQKSVDEINEQTLKSLDLMLTISQNLIIFALEMMIGTYACLIVAAVDGAVDVAVNSTESIIHWVNDTLGHVTDDIEGGLTDISNLVNEVISAAEKVKDFFDGGYGESDTEQKFQNVNMTINGLRNLQIPSSINDNLDKLRDNTPDFDTVKNKTENLIKEPFQFIKKQIQNAKIVSNDGDSLYVPNLESVTICSDNKDKIETFYNDLSEIIYKLVIAFVILLIILGALAIVPAVYSEYRKWGRLSQLKAETTMDKDPILTYETVFNRYPTKAGVAMSKIAGNEESQTQIRWLMSYILSSRASIPLGLSIAGFIVVAFQFIILNQLQNAIKNGNSPFTKIGDNISSKISDSIILWTDSANGYLETKESDMNDQLFSWVRNATQSVNSTISTFVDDMNAVIADAFNGTILYAPVKTVIGCVIENKLIKVEKGLTWVYDHSEVKFPRVTDEYLALAFEDSNGTSTMSSGSYNNGTYTNGTYYGTSLNGTNSTYYNGTTTDISNYANSEMMQKTSNMVSSTENMMKNLLELTIKTYRDGLMLEIWIATALFVIWITQFIIALIKTWYALSHLSTAESSNEKLQISCPRELTKEEQLVYGYPYLDPFKDPAVEYENPFQNSKITIGYDDPIPKVQRALSYDDSSSTLGDGLTSRKSRNPFESPLDDNYDDRVSNILTVGSTAHDRRLTHE
jgi:hypothetical protein